MQFDNYAAPELAHANSLSKPDSLESTFISKLRHCRHCGCESQEMCISYNCVCPDPTKENQKGCFCYVTKKEIVK